MPATIDITKALAIDGFMSEPELAWLAQQAVEHRSIVEIGSFLGRSTRAMLDHTLGIVYALDDWKGPRDVYYDPEERKQFYHQFVDNTKDCKNLIAVVGDFDLDLCGPLEPDMVFVDGSHEYLDVLRDIKRWWPRLKEDGLMSGHDCSWPDVQRAICDYFGGSGRVRAHEDIWYVYKTAGARSR